MEKDLVSLAERFAGLPPTTEPEFYARIAQMVTTPPGLDPGLLQSLLDSKEYQPHHFAAFYALLVSCRRRKDFSQFREILNRYHTAFSEEPIMPHLQAEAISYLSNQPHELHQALRYARSAVVKMPTLPGVHYLLAEILVRIQESIDSDTNVLIEAEREIEKAIAHSKNHIPSTSRFVLVFGLCKDASVMRSKI